MRDSAWKYLLKFTAYYEAAVLHMYNNRKDATKPQDVTCGIGFRLPSRASACEQWVKDMFIGDPSDADMMADWDAAAAILRTGNSIAAYAKACKLRMDADKVNQQMARRLAGVVKDLNAPGAYANQFLLFDEWPAQAQVGLVSYAYGWSPAKAPKMSGDLESWHFEQASKECSLTGASQRKNLAHKALFHNAGVISDDHLDLDQVPLTCEGITLL
jgi:hypothetical protein